MPNHNLHKMYLISPQQFTVLDQKVNKPKNVSTTRKKNKQNDNITKWKEQSRDLQMKLIKKMQNHRKLQSLEHEKQNEVDQNILTKIVPNTTRRSLVLDTPKPSTPKQQQPAKSQTPKSNASVFNKKRTFIEKPLPSPNVVVTRKEQMQSVNKNSQNNNFSDFINPFSSRPNVQHSTKKSSNQQKGQGYINWITID